ncbi:outer membrane protein assembly factor BamA [bacterium]|nr:outer membrane protein assembly factor BamA [bacterium]
MVTKINSLKLCLVLFLLCFSNQISAQVKTIEILDIRVDGNSNASPEMVKLNSGLYVGQKASGDDIQNAIKQLWALKVFSDVKILSDKQVDKGVYLLILVKEYPKLAKVEFSGNEELDDTEAAQTFGLIRGQTISPTIIKRAENKIKKFYFDEGFLLAQIKTTEEISEGQVKLKVQIDEGKKIQIERITFTGNETFSDGTLRKQMKDIKENAWWRSADFDPKKYDADKENVLSFYRKSGFRDAEILSDTTYYDETQQDLYINIKVNEGIKYYFGEITWEGNSLWKKLQDSTTTKEDSLKYSQFTTESLNEILGIKKGDVYNKEKLDNAVYDKISGIYYDIGHIYAQIDAREIPVSQDTVNLHFSIYEGNPVKINLIKIIGNTKTKERVIRRELVIIPGDTFSKEALVRSQRELFILNYFGNVVPDVKPIPESEDKVDLVFQVEERSTDTANMSAGYSQRDKWVGSIGIVMNNFLGNGQRLGFDWQFGKGFRSFQLSFSEPWLLMTKTRVSGSIFDISRQRSSIYSYTSREIGGSVGIGRRFTIPDDYFRGDWILNVSKRTYKDFASETIQQNLEDNQGVRASLTEIFTRDSRNRAEFPTEGSVVTLTTEYSNALKGNGADYHKHIFQVEKYFPLWWKFVLYTDLTLGAIQEIQENKQIDINELFFLGGGVLTFGTPLRGYGQQEIGPKDKYGNALGGKTLIKYSAEIRVPVVNDPTIYALIFGEAGNVFNSYASSDPFQVYRSVGIGFRVFLPLVGIIGLDYGFGYDHFDKNGKRNGQGTTHFQFGKPF